MSELSKKDFFADVLEKCLSNKIELKLIFKKTHMGCAGWCNDLELVSCFNREDALDILVHESCHLDQYLEKSKHWFAKELSNSNIWDIEWKQKYPRKYLNAIKKTCELEIDCNIRSVKKIKKYNLDIDINNYISSSNCYHASYYYFNKYNCFYDPDNNPYQSKQIINSFDNKKITDLKNIWKPHKILGEYLEKYHKKL